MGGATGMRFLLIDYRLAPKHPFPAAVDDVRRAIRFVKENAKQYKVDPGRIALIGESAGGHLVSYVGARHNPRTAVNAVVSFYGIHQVDPVIELFGKMLGAGEPGISPERLRDIDDAAFVNAVCNAFAFPPEEKLRTT